MATTVQKGSKFRSGYADANPEWEVMSKAGRDAWRCRVTDDCPDYSGTVKLFSTKEIKHSLGWSAMFAEAGKQSEDFYASAKLGSIVHYHNGFKQYVRCEVVMGVSKLRGNGRTYTAPEKCLKPIALIGEWRAYDLAQRMADGSIHYGYHAKAILTEDFFNPSASNIYENPGFGHRNEGDPRSMPPVDLSVPEMSQEAEAKAKLEQLRQKIRKVLEETRDAEEALKLTAQMLAQSAHRMVDL